MRLSRWFRGPSDPHPLPVVVGSPRSGTTLLRLMLDAHPLLAIPPETGFLPAVAQLEGAGDELRLRFQRTVTGFPASAPGWVDFGIPAEAFAARLAAIEPFTVADGCRAFYRLYAERCGKPRWGEKTPLYCRHLPLIAALLPEAHFVHLVRDGRDAAVSLRERWFSPGHDIEVQAAHWRDNVVAAREGGARCAHFVEVRYEDLVGDPAGVLRRLCRFLHLPYDPLMLRYYEHAPARLEEHRARHRADGTVLVTREERLRQQAMVQRPPDATRIGVWREALSAAEAARFEAVAGDLLAAYGYSPAASSGGLAGR